MTESQAKVTRCGRVRTALSWSSYKRRRIEREFDTLALQIGLRNKVLEESRGKIVALFPNDAAPPAQTVFRLAAVDLFVEKAQDALTRRARNMVFAGIATSAGAVAALMILSLFIAQHASDIPYDHALNVNVLLPVSYTHLTLPTKA